MRRIKQAEKAIDNDKLFRNVAAQRRSQVVPDEAGTASKPKPNIEQVFEVFQEFQNDTRRAGINVKLWAKARLSCQEKLDKLGLAEHIDWTEK
jgi:hypothetical protein